MVLTIYSTPPNLFHKYFSLKDFSLFSKKKVTDLCPKTLGFIFVKRNNGKIAVLWMFDIYSLQQKKYTLSEYYESTPFVVNSNSIDFV